MGSNKAGCFLEAAVFVEGGWKGAIRLPEGHGGWGWQRFIEELRLLIAQLVVKVLPAVPVVNVEVVGSPPSYADVLVVAPGGLKLSFVEALALGEVCFDGGRCLLMGGGDCLMEAMRILAIEFLAKVRVEVDRVIFFGFGLKIKASRDTRKRMVWVFSWLGLKPKLLPGLNLRGRSRLKQSGRILRPRPLDADSRVKANVGVIGVPDPDLGQGETSSEKVPVVISGDDVSMGSAAISDEVVSAAPLGKSSFAKSLLWPRFLRPASLSPPEEEAVLALGFVESSATRDVLSAWVSEKGMIWSGFLLRRSHVSSSKGFVLWTSSGEAQESHRSCSLEERLPSFGSDKAPDLDLVLDLGLGLDLDPGLVPVFAASLTSLVATVSSVIRAPTCLAAASGSLVMFVASVSRVRQFSFPSVLENAPLNFAHAQASFVSRSSLGLRSEAIQLYRVSRRELEKRLLIACFVYFEDKGSGSRIEVRDVW